MKMHNPTQNPEPRAHSSPHPPQANRGFTLTELLLAGGILTIVLGALLVSFLSGQSSYLSMDASIQVQEETRRAFDAMVRELREAKIISPANGATSQTLVFNVALGYNDPASSCNGVCWGAYNSSGAKVINNRVRYRIINGQIIRDIVDASNNPITPKVERVLANLVDTAAATSNFGVSASGDIVTIKLQTKTPISSLIVGGPRASGVLTTQVKLRNL